MLQEFLHDLHKQNSDEGEIIITTIMLMWSLCTMG